MKDNNNNNIIISKGELLFWKIIRNKYLFKIILQSFNKHSFKYLSYGYYEINNVEWLIKHKHFSLLKDKITSGKKDLSFYLPNININMTFNSKSELSITHSIFQIPSPWKQDRELYSSLFKNYYSYFLSTLPIKQVVLKLIEYDNPVSLDLIINHYKIYKPELSDLIYSIQCKSFMSTKFLLSILYSNQSQQKINSQLEGKIWKLIFKSSGVQIDEKVAFLINDMKFSIDSIGKDIGVLVDYKIDYLIYNETLGKLIESCTSVAVLGISSQHWELNKSILEKISFGSLDGLVLPLLKETFQPLTISELAHIKSQFTLDQLSTKLKDFNLQNSNLEFQLNIFKLTTMLVPFMCDKQHIFNYLYYLIMYKDFQDGSGIGSGIGSLKYIVSLELRKFLFENCKGRKNVLSKFLSNFINNGIGFKILNELFEMLVVILDTEVEFIDIVIIELRKKFIQNPNNGTNIFELKFPILSSTRMFDYLYCNYREILTELNLNEFLIHACAIPVLKHFKNVYPKDYNHYKKQFQLSIYPGYPSISIKFIVDNFEDFNVDPVDENNPTSSKHLLFNHKNVKSISINRILKQGQTNNVVQENHGNNGNIDSGLKIRYFLDNCTFIKFENLIPLYNYLINPLNLNVGCFYVLNEISKRGDTQSLETILKFKNKWVIHRVLQFSILYGQLSMFQYIKNSATHSWILGPLTTTSFPLNLNDFEEFFQMANKCNHHHLLNYFKNELKFNSKNLKINKSFI